MQVVSHGNLDGRGWHGDDLAIVGGAFYLLVPAVSLGDNAVGVAAAIISCPIAS